MLLEQIELATFHNPRVYVEHNKSLSENVPFFKLCNSFLIKYIPFGTDGVQGWFRKVSNEVSLQ